MIQRILLESFFVNSGSTDGRIHVWRTADGEKLTTLSTDSSSDSIQCVQFNPKSFMLATASTNMVCFICIIQSFLFLSLFLDLLVTTC